ncbi:MAG TPA: protein-disulfide reductase DsbD domain-containing protein [Blastocatellia bacterium]|nr:protein-disulfide reductase DsbD domain-containing protein [Blastocatellia bacterium]
MKSIKLLGSIAILFGLTAIAEAQTSASVIKIRPALSVDKVKQGSSFQTAIVLEIQSGYHVNSNRPADPSLIPTALKLDRLQGFTLGVVTYPRGATRKFSFSDQPLSVYEGTVVLKFSAKAAPSAGVGTANLSGKLKVQACNDQICLRPETVEVTIPVEVVGPSTQTKSINGEIFGPPRRK